MHSPDSEEKLKADALLKDNKEDLEGTWLERREKLVRQALEDEDLAALQSIAALPGGYGTNELRKEAWERLLHIKEFFPPQEDDKDPNEAKRNDERTVGSTDPGHGAQGYESGSHLHESSCSAAPHPDEGQVLLDTKRSFVTYPKDLPKESKLVMQDDLQSLIVHVLRLYPTLSYFQGYHDIMSVLYLTFIPLPDPPQPRSRSSSARRGRGRSGSLAPLGGSTTPLEADHERKSSLPDAQTESQRRLDPTTSEKDSDGAERGRRGSKEETNGREAANDRSLADWATLRHCAEVVSLCRVRDAMGHSMNPMMGLLKMLQRLLKAADPELSEFSSTISPVPTLPFFALSWILCLFSHDIDSLEPVQRMFDFLLSRNPVSAIYLAVAILVAKKDQMFRLAKELGPEAQDDPSLLHPLFSRLPPLYADLPDQPYVRSETKDLDNPYDPIPISTIFRITDELMARYPWDGPEIRGREIMGPGSVVNTFSNEFDIAASCWSLKEAEGYSDREVVLPGATEPDEEEEEIPEPVPRRKVRRRKNKNGMAIAVGMVAIGVGIAIYGYRAGGSRADWTGWWATVVRSWLDRRGWTERMHGWLRVYIGMA